MTEKKRTWNHNICWACWWKRTDARGEPGREPTRVVHRSDEWHCCFCGVHHWSGIFVRENPENVLLKCKGFHVYGAWN